MKASMAPHGLKAWAAGLGMAVAGIGTAQVVGHSGPR